MYVATFTKAGGPGVKYDVERIGLGFRSDGRIEAAKTAMSTTCKMQRP